MSNESNFVDLLNREMEELQRYLQGKKEPKTAVESENFVRPFVYKIEKLMFENYKKDQRIAELEEQLKYAIVPKFKIGQMVYTFNKYQDCVYTLDLISVHIERYETSKFNSLVYRAKRLKDGFITGYQEEDLFATKEEAQAKLEELKGE